MIEVLVAVMVLGLAFVALIGGFGVSIASSDLHRKQAVAETVIRRYAEAVKQVECTSSGGCPSASESYSVAAVATRTGFTIPAGFTGGTPQCRDASGTYSNVCPTSGVQLVKISIVSTDNRVDANLELVKRLT